jgi:hypothetical protein
MRKRWKVRVVPTYSGDGEQYGPILFYTQSGAVRFAKRLQECFPPGAVRVRVTRTPKEPTYARD